MEQKDIRMNFLINPDLRQRLKHQSVRENRPMSKIISELIEQYLNQVETGE
jgi:predicted DNA-binding protein